MKREYLEIGCTPYEEDCAQVGQENFRELASLECQQYIKALRVVYGVEPIGAELGIKWNPHDFGSYTEVVCYYEPNNEKAINYAYTLESGIATWKEANMEAPSLNENEMKI